MHRYIAHMPGNHEALRSMEDVEELSAEPTREKSTHECSQIDECPQEPAESEQGIPIDGRYIPPQEFPLFQVCVLFFASLTGALPLTSLFPYVAPMMVDLGAAPDVDRAGFVSGYVASSFMFGRLLSSFYWGHKADAIGRKPVIYISCVAIAIFSVCFGLSGDIWMALISRFLLGFLNPLNSLTKTLISEICSKQHQPMGMAVAAGPWSVGLVVGPALGGSLARSAELYPGTILDNPMTRQFPYLLPNALTGMFGLISLVLVQQYLPETLPPQKVISTPVHTGASASNLEEGKSSNKYNSSIQEDGKQPDNPFMAIVNNASELMKDTKVRRACAAYFSLSLSAIIYDECLPLWALSSSDKGGLGMTSAMIGNVTSLTGIPMLAFTFILFPLLNEKFGEAACYRYCQLISNMFALLTVVVAASGGLTGNSTIPVLVFVASGEKSFACVAFTANFLLINESVPAERRGSVNGFAMTIGGIAKTIGPMMGATLYAWSINNGIRSPPFNFVFVFICCFLIGIVTVLIRLSDIESSSPARGRHSDTTDEMPETSNNFGSTISVLHKDYKELYSSEWDDNTESGDNKPTVDKIYRQRRATDTIIQKCRYYIFNSRLIFRKVAQKCSGMFAAVVTNETTAASEEAAADDEGFALSPIHHHEEQHSYEENDGGDDIDPRSSCEGN